MPVSHRHVVFISKWPDSSLSFQEVKSHFTENNPVKIAWDVNQAESHWYSSSLELLHFSFNWGNQYENETEKKETNTPNIDIYKQAYYIQSFHLSSKVLSLSMMIKNCLCKDEWYFDTDLLKKSDNPKKHFSRN